LVAIQGSAGSGKTTVGLHRVAYLAFHDPQRFRPEKMFVVVPNDALVHYVSRVLPSLGVEGVPVTTFTRFASRLVAQMFPRLPTATSDETPPVVSRAKSHAAMLRGIDRIVACIGRDVDARVRSAMARWPDGERVATAWDATEKTALGETPPDARVSRCGAVARRKAAATRHDASAAFPEVTRSALEQLMADLRGQTRSVSGAWDELPGLRARRLRRRSCRSRLWSVAARIVHAWV
jgi:DNA helicase-2/ATP-dependent DNA helicase PcrA